MSNKHIPPSHQDHIDRTPGHSGLDGTELSDVPSDLDRNPGIGQSKGAFRTGEDPEELELDNTVEGDVANDTNRVGGLDPDKLGRTNR